MANRFPRAASFLLRESGERAALNGAGGVVLSRALCRFTPFRSPPGLSAGERERAARLHAEAHAPFTTTDTLLLREGENVAIWQWDREQVRSLLGDAPYRADFIVPETALHTPHTGWRQVATTDGYEAQYWRDGALIAAQWRREPFTEPAWAAFALAADGRDAPVTPPTADHVPLSALSWRQRRIGAQLGWQDVERTGATLVLCAAAIGVFFAAQAIRYDGVAARERAQIRAMDQVPGAGAELSAIRNYAAHIPARDPLRVAVETLSILDQFGAEPVALRVDEERLFVELRTEGARIAAEDLAYALESDRMIANVRPETSGRGRMALTADLADAP